MKSVIVKSFRSWSRINPPAGKKHSQQDALSFFRTLEQESAGVRDWPSVLDCLLKEGLVK